MHKKHPCLKTSPQLLGPWLEMSLEEFRPLQERWKCHKAQRWLTRWEQSTSVKEASGKLIALMLACWHLKAKRRRKREDRKCMRTWNPNTKGTQPPPTIEWIEICIKFGLIQHFEYSIVLLLFSLYIQKDLLIKKLDVVVVVVLHQRRKRVTAAVLWLINQSINSRDIPCAC